MISRSTNYGVQTAMKSFLSSIIVMSLFLTFASVCGAETNRCDPVMLPVTPIEPANMARQGARFSHFELKSDSAAPVKGKTIYEEGFILHDLKAGTTCQADEGITEEVYLSRNQAHLIFVSYSGSMRDVRTVAVQGCREEAHLSVFTLQNTFTNNVFSIEPACECTVPDKSRCQCSPGGVYDLGNDCGFHRLDQASLDQSTKVLGVRIAKEGWVAYPGTAKAKLLGNSEGK